MTEFNYQYEIYYMMAGYNEPNQPCPDNILVKLVDFRTQRSLARVAFDYQFVIDWEDKYGNVIGFFHTHPRGMSDPSSTDIKTMTGWCQCLGKDLLCSIDCGDGVSVIPFRFNAKKGSVKIDVDISDYVYFKTTNMLVPYMGENVMLPINNETITFENYNYPSDSKVSIERESEELSQSQSHEKETASNG